MTPFDPARYWGFQNYFLKKQGTFYVEGMANFGEHVDNILMCIDSLFLGRYCKIPRSNLR
jgi:hypothetical protein